VTNQPTKTRPGDQPLPTGGQECVQDELIRLIEERKQLGIQRYGSPLMTHNGRDAGRDAVEEALDLTVYSMQVALELRDLRTATDRVLTWVAGLDDIARKLAGPEAKHPVAEHIRYLLDIGQHEPGQPAVPQPSATVLRTTLAEANQAMEMQREFIGTMRRIVMNAMDHREDEQVTEQACYGCGQDHMSQLMKAIAAGDDKYWQTFQATADGPARPGRLPDAPKA
jgi:hypothetical protein